MFQPPSGRGLQSLFWELLLKDKIWENDGYDEFSQNLPLISSKYGSVPPQKPCGGSDIYRVPLWKLARKNPETVVVSGFSAPISKSVLLVGCGGGMLPRFGGKPPRLKVPLSAPPTILLYKNGNLLCGGIVLADFSKTARRRVLHQGTPRPNAKKHPQGVLFVFG